MEIDLLVDYPKINRDIAVRFQEKTNSSVLLAKQFGWEYFDMKSPRICYGGYVYDGRWKPIVKKFIDYYNLKDNSNILDVGCAKCYMLYDFLQINPKLNVVGVDISKYAINSRPPNIHAIVGNANDLSMFPDKIFDLVTSINVIHNLYEYDCRKAVREIQRVGKNAYIVVDAYSNDEEKARLLGWNVTANTILSVDEWRTLFKEENYAGDYYWFIP